MALYYAYQQNKNSEETIKDTKKSIDQEIINRQLSLLPKLHYIIDVRTELESYLSDLKKIKNDLERSIQNKDHNILKKVSNSHIMEPEDLDIVESFFKTMPEWLQEIQISGCQYYYNLMCNLKFLYKNEKGDLSFAETVLDRANESIDAIEELLSYISDMVPGVILRAPASLSASRFFRKH